MSHDDNNSITYGDLVGYIKTAWNYPPPICLALCYPVRDSNSLLHDPTVAQMRHRAEQFPRWQETELRTFLLLR